MASEWSSHWTTRAELLSIVIHVSYSWLTNYSIQVLLNMVQHASLLCTELNNLIWTQWTVDGTGLQSIHVEYLEISASATSTDEMTTYRLHVQEAVAVQWWQELIVCKTDRLKVACFLHLIQHDTELRFDYINLHQRHHTLPPVTSQLHTKLEALGQCISLPRQVLSGPVIQTDTKV